MAKKHEPVWFHQVFTKYKAAHFSSLEVAKLPFLQKMCIMICWFSPSFLWCNFCTPEVRYDWGNIRPVWFHQVCPKYNAANFFILSSSFFSWKSAAYAAWIADFPPFLCTWHFLCTKSRVWLREHKARGVIPSSLSKVPGSNVTFTNTNATQRLLSYLSMKVQFFLEL